MKHFARGTAWPGHRTGGAAQVSPRLSSRMWRHHLPLAATTGLAAWALYVIRPYPDVITRLSFATAWPALALLAATLAIGPWRILQGKPAVLSLDLRRDIGIWAGIAGLLHVGIGQCVHLRGRPWLYYVYEKMQGHLLPLRHDLFGFANFTGLFAALILIALLATSNDSSLRKFTGSGWKSLQRWNYACFALAACHTFGYLLGIESLKLPFIIVATLCVMGVVILQCAGFRRRA
jgi:sulfoxide reductase heme-binding subunit YedZ